MSTDLHPSTQLLQRNADIFHGRILLVQPVETAAIAFMQTLSADITVSTTAYDMFIAAEKIAPSHFETHHVATKPYDQAIIFLPKSDAEIAMTLHWAAHTVGPEGEIILVGQNDAGIKSAKKTLEQTIGSVTYSDAARHSALYVAKRTITPTPFALEDYWQTYSASTTIQHSAFSIPHLTFFSLPGVFSHGRLDEGTELLLANLPTTQAKKILDWGSGSGVIGCILAQLHPDAQIDMADVSALAVAATKKSIAANNLQNAHALPSAVFSHVPNAYDLIIANPPFHKGHDTHYGDSETFLLQAKQHLTEHGQLVIVANSFLHYEQFIEKGFGYVKTVAKTNKYKVLETVNATNIVTQKFKRKPRFSNDALEEAEW